MGKKKLNIIVSAMVLGVTAAAQAAPATFTSGVYTEDFDEMGTTGASSTTAPAGWTVGALGFGGAHDGTHDNVTNGGGAINASSTIVVDNGTNLGNSPNTGTIGRTFNWGITSAYGNVTDRALGNIPTTTGKDSSNTNSAEASGDRIMQLALTNNTGAPITSMMISYTGEEWRRGQDTPNGTEGPQYLRFYYSTSPDSDWSSVGLDWLAPQQAGPNNALDGNDPLNRTVLSINYTLPTALANGDTFYLRWEDWNDKNISDAGLAIDDVSVTVPLVEVPEPASLSLIGLAATSLLFRRKRK